MRNIIIAIFVTVCVVEVLSEPTAPVARLNRLETRATNLAANNPDANRLPVVQAKATALRNRIETNRPGLLAPAPGTAAPAPPATNPAAPPATDPAAPSATDPAAPPATNPAAPPATDPAAPPATDPAAPPATDPATDPATTT